MDLNEHEIEGHDHAAVSLKVLLLIFAVVLVGALSYFVWLSNVNPIAGTDYSAPVVTTKTDDKADATTETSTAEEANVACGEEAYAFSLTFGSKWTGYKIKEVKPDYALVTCYVTLPTTSTEVTWTESATDHAKGYASVFAVSVYTPAQWEEAKVEANPPTEMGKNDQYIWSWSQAQALPQDLQDSKISDEIKTVVATFKIAE